MQVNSHELNKRGWTKEEINKTQTILKRIEHAHHKSNTNHQNIVYVVLSSAVIVGNLFFALFLVPIFATLDLLTTLIITAIVASLFGMMFSIIISDLEKLEKTHHYAATIIIPIVSFINVAIIVNYGNSLISFPAVPQIHNPFIIAAVFAIAFIIPHVKKVVKP